MKTLKAFIAASHVSEKLIRSVVRQFGGWADFKESAEDIASHGADAGWSGFIYYADTVKFAKRNRQEILAAAEAMADELGERGASSLIKGFGCLRSEGLSETDVMNAIYRRNDPNAQVVLNALAWFALEEVARSYVDRVEAE
ncbi:DUF7222 domain-containing protein [Stutzerimonas stutzeri]|uniref:DUF7222 domain-containing protein n=1 Tax=Stutzerimonas stutzeri TaxID=316 RepID=UPI003098B378